MRTRGHSARTLTDVQSMGACVSPRLSGRRSSPREGTPEPPPPSPLSGGGGGGAEGKATSQLCVVIRQVLEDSQEPRCSHGLFTSLDKSPPLTEPQYTQLHNKKFSLNNSAPAFQDFKI